jgi:hypothetical protein
MSFISVNVVVADNLFDIRYRIKGIPLMSNNLKR